jgi:carbonic anhydrase/acetyltransferase-like protein (isoleucine patch superfamily)
MGAPGKVVRDLDDAAVAGLRASARLYEEKAARFRAGLRRIG